MAQAFFVILGQSNGGFYGDVALPGCPWPGQVGYNFLNNTFAPYVDPFPGWAIPGGPGSGGSIWSRLGYLLYANPANPWDMIVWAPLIKEAQSSALWRPDGVCFPRITALKANWAAHNPPFQPTAYLWINGETDAWVTSMPYGYHTESVRQMVTAIRATGDNAPVFTSISTTCRAGAGGPDFGGLPQHEQMERLRRQDEMQREQHLLPDVLAHLNVRRGPNHDLISTHSRFDFCHYNSNGQYIAARQWEKVLLNAHAQRVIQ